MVEFRKSKYTSRKDQQEVFNPIALMEEFISNGLVGDKYQRLGELARGGMGVIYRAVDLGLNRPVVLKVITPELLSRPDLIARFVEEARITGQLEHPNIVPVHDIGVLDGNQIYFTMKHVKGRELWDILEDIRLQNGSEDSKLSLFALLTIFRKVCDAIAFAHSKGIIHRDIKPDNIIVGDFGEVLVMDWGLARRLDGSSLDEQFEYEAIEEQNPHTYLGRDSSRTVIRTQMGIIKGTPAYMAPEMASGDSGKVDTRSDIFLLGALLYSIATLEAPFASGRPDDDIYDILERAEKCEFLPPSERNPSRQIPHELERIILKAMAYRKVDRYQTVEELAHDIDALLEGRVHSEHRIIPKGEHLIVENELEAEAYVIIKGTAEVYKTINGTPTTLVRLGPGATVGEMSLLDKAPRSASVVALEDLEVAVIREDTLKQALAKMPPWLGRTINALSARLRKTNTIIHPLRQKDPFFHVLNATRLILPTVGKPFNHPQFACDVVTLDMQIVIPELAELLSIPPDDILQVFNRLANTGLIEVINQTHIAIPNT
ncbi:MAG: hypothetical protein D6820_01615, partial [Lentisphaerae bacterium]